MYECMIVCVCVYEGGGCVGACLCVRMPCGMYIYEFSHSNREEI